MFLVVRSWVLCSCWSFFSVSRLELGLLYGGFVYVFSYSSVIQRPILSLVPRVGGKIPHQIPLAGAWAGVSRPAWISFSAVSFYRPENGSVCDPGILGSRSAGGDIRPPYYGTNIDVFVVFPGPGDAIPSEIRTRPPTEKRHRKCTTGTDDTGPI